MIANFKHTELVVLFYGSVLEFDLQLLRATALKEAFIIYVKYPWKIPGGVEPC